MTNPSSKTICFFNSNKAWGGGEKWHLTTAKELQHQGFNTFIVGNMRSELATKAVTERMLVYRFHVSNLSFLNPIKIFIMMLFFKTKKIDAIVLNLPSDLKLAGIAAKLAGVKKIIYRRGMPHPLRSTWLNRFLFTKILTHIVVNSKEVGRSLKEGNEIWFPEEKMILIYNGVDSKRVIDKTRRLILKQGDEIIIGNAGRLTEQKGQKYLIELAKILKDKGMNFKIFIAGEGELHHSLQKMIDEAQVQEQVKLLGHVNDMSAFFNSLDVFVFTSLYEGMANTLIETLQHGIPTIAWDVSSNPEIIQDGMTGFLAPVSNVNDLAKHIQNLVSNQEIRQRLETNGQKSVQENFDHRKNLESLINILSA